MVLWFFTSLMVAACSLAFLYFAFRGNNGQPVQENSAQQLYLAQQATLKENYKNGQISQKALAIAETELARHFIKSNQNKSENKEFSPMQAKLLLGVSVLFIAGLSFGLYNFLGSPEYKDMPLAARQNAPIKEQSLDQLIARAEARIAQNPNDIKGWKVLAPIYRRLGRIDDAIYAYRTIMAAEPKSADAAAELGEISFIEAGRVVNAESKQLFERAAELDPAIIKPRFYLALADFQQGDRVAALIKFKKILQSSPADAPWLPIIKQYIDAIENNSDVNSQSQAPNATNDEKPDIRQNKQVLGMVQGLAERLAEDPDDIDGWLRLIRSYKVLGNNEAYDKAVEDARTQYKDQSDELTQIEQLIKSLNQ